MREQVMVRGIPCMMFFVAAATFRIWLPSASGTLSSVYSAKQLTAAARRLCRLRKQASQGAHCQRWSYTHFNLVNSDVVATIVC